MSSARLRGRRPGAPSLSSSKLVACGVAIAAILSMAGIAVAASTTLGTGKAKVSGKSETVVVDSRGVTLYTLSGETAHHLKCTSSMCIHFWPPDKVSASAKLTKAKGVRGKLSKLHRAGYYQVMLNGHPLYGFAGDNGKKGSATGDGLATFGGTWHVVAAG